MSDAMKAEVRVGLLGPLEVRVGDELVAPGGPKLRAIIAQLALAGGRIVSVDDLLEGVWGEDLPATARNTLQYHVGVLRKALAAYGAAEALVTRDPGYGLTAETDVSRFLDGVGAASREAAAGRNEEAAAAYTEALNLWHGHALADLRDFEFADARAVALEAQRLTCLEAWADAENACGRADSLIAPLQELVSENPTRERLWEQLMVALYRTGRQDAALSAFRTARQALDRELGVEPSARLNEVHQAILRQDPKLQPVRALHSIPVRPMSQTILARSEVVGAPPSLVAPGGKRLLLTGAPVVIGRHGDCDLVLSDEQASRRHAQVEAGPRGFVLVDLGSTNGTFLNGQRVEGATPLGHGDRIEIGHAVVHYFAS
ncbi:MAG TPA: BTAD domain-containing putative transcriptional regulator [Nocardioidaceae bacterium]|nr:BTAD domain-containing putative transcriptional regulator [Nocardioidaceae bacterium]